MEDFFLLQEMTRFITGDPITVNETRVWRSSVERAERKGTSVERAERESNGSFSEKESRRN